MNKNEKLISIIMPISITLILSLSIGICSYFFFGNLNFFGEQGFHHDAGLFWSGACLGTFGLSPVIITSLFALLKYKKQTKVSLVIMARYMPAGLSVSWLYQDIKI